MLLFHAVSAYQLLMLTEYKIKYFTQDEAVLLLPDSLIQKFPQYDNLRKYFKDILLYEISKPKDRNISIKEATRGYFDAVFKQRGYDIAGFEEIFVGCAHYYFGIYLASNDIPFVFFEDASGMLSRPEILIEMEEKYPIKREYNMQYGLYDGTCPCIRKVVCNKNAQCKEVGDVEHFDVVEELLVLSETDREWIKKFFTDIDVLEIKQNAVLFLTQHFANLQILSFEQQILIYQTVFDYFFEGREVVIKPHPNDIMYYGKLFPQYKIIREVFPSEFLPIMFTNKPDVIATISSTAINNLYRYFPKSFCLGTRYEKDFIYTHRYFTAISLIQQMKFSKGQICEIGTNEKMFGAFLNMISEETVADLTNAGNAHCYIVDDIECSNKETRESIIDRMEQLEEQSAMIFINSRMDYCFYDFFHKALWNHIVPVCIKKEKLRNEEFYADVDQEIIYVYSKSREIRDMAENYRMKKNLSNMGMDIEVTPLSLEEQRIKVLEGQLEATEKRLLYYIQIVDKDKMV